MISNYFTKDGDDNLNGKLKEKIRESVSSVLPITIIVGLICFFILPVSLDTMMLFLVGAIFLIFGMGFFSLGAEISMSLIGERIGANLSKSRNVWIIALVSFILGTIITVAEPDLLVLAELIKDIPNLTLVITVGIGVGIFLAVAMLRIIFKISLSKILIVLYFIVFGISFFVPKSFLSIAFDAGGVTTGPLTVPFIMALGIGTASIRNDKNSERDSFGLVALCSVGPILAVMILGLLYKVTNTEYTYTAIETINNSKDIGTMFIKVIPYYCLQVLRSLSPIFLFFILSQIFCLKLPKQEVVKVLIGFLYTFLGLVIFFVGVNVGFLPVGNSLGESLMTLSNRIIVVPIMFVIGYFIVQAEPAVLILVKQVSDITLGMVSEKLMKVALSIGMAIALVISVLRAWLGIPIYFFIIPRILDSFSTYVLFARNVYRNSLRCWWRDFTVH